MTDSPSSTSSTSTPKWRIVGPGLVVAATGVGAGDLVATLVAGSRFGYTLLWAAVLGTIIKIILVEGAGRYSLASGRTIFEGWRSLGRWTTWYFAPYIVIWGFVYGATAMSSSALPLATLFPSVDLKIFAIAMGLLGFVMVSLGSYAAFEKVIAVLVGIMFVTVVGAAAVAGPNIPEVLNGLIPRIPNEPGSLFYVLGLAGGVGGTITLAAYGYWLREKGWSTPRWMQVMRIDNTVAYVVTGIFVIAMLVVGAELLYSANIAMSGKDGDLLKLAAVLDDRYGTFFRWVFLIGFWASSFSSLIGVWNGVSLMFGDFVGNLRGLESGAPETRTGGLYPRIYILWLTFPPMLLLFLNQPVGLIVAYGVLGAIFMPFLAVTLLALLNGQHTPKEWRNKWVSNLFLLICTVMFAALAVNEIRKVIATNF